jgi:hypothetical protein
VRAGSPPRCRTRTSSRCSRPAWQTAARSSRRGSSRNLSDADLEGIRSGGRLAQLYDLVVFPGHREYVTQREYDTVRGYRDRGGNLAWLSANNFFWKVVRRGPELERVARWRTLGRPEASLIGVQYRGNDEGQRRGPMRPVPEAAPWLFTGTPMQHGEPWGDFGIEIDHIAPSSPAGTTVIASVPDLYWFACSAASAGLRRGATAAARPVRSFCRGAR